MVVCPCKGLAGTAAVAVGLSDCERGFLPRALPAFNEGTLTVNLVTIRAPSLEESESFGADGERPISVSARSDASRAPLDVLN